MFTNRIAGLSDDEDRKDVFAPVADLMVGVVFIFIILMFALSLNFQPDKVVPRADYERLQQQNRDLQAKVATLSEEKHRLVQFVQFVRDNNVKALLERLSRADQTRSAILSDMRTRLKQAGIDVTVNSEAGTLALPSQRLFASGQADPTIPDGHDTILRLGQVMTDVLPCYTGTVTTGGCASTGDFSSLSAVYIEGHTDITPFGSMGAARFRDNWDLSAGRAIEAYKLIRDDFQQIRDLRNQQGEALVGVSGYADTRPAAPDEGDRSSPEAKDKDRRIEVRIIMSTNEEKVGAVLNDLNRRLESVDDLIQ